MRFYILCLYVCSSIFLFTSNSYAETTEKKFPYSMSKRDFLLAPLGLAMNIGAGIADDNVSFNISIDEIKELNRYDINKLDRIATHNWDPEAGKVSDVFYKAMPIIAPTIVLPHLLQKEWTEAATISLMYIEVYWYTKSLTLFSKSISQRIRPYLYNTSLTPDQRFSFQGNEAPSASTSFFSGHTSATFASAVFMSKVFQDIHGKGKWSRIIWGTSISAAVVTAFARVKSGEHYPTDVLAGALVGSAVGYFIPHLHKKKRVQLSTAPGAVFISYRF